jgi:uncharacterized cupredoxin-like copper-binding protein
MLMPRRFEVRDYRRRRQATAGLAGLALAACLSAAPTSDPVIPGSAEAPRAINVIMRDYLFEPTPLRLVRGETVRFTVINAGLLAHDFVLGAADVQTAWASAEAVSTPPAFTATPPPASVLPALAGLRIYLLTGQSASILYAVPPAGDLLLVCQVPGHAALGMVGAIAVVEPSSP